MTYRERREARAERLRAWSGKRAAKAESAHNAAHSLASQIPLGQPILVGHHSERRARRDAERIRAGFTRSMEHADKAAEMARRADQIDAQAARAIYSDDSDAPERLRERIGGWEAERARLKAYNASCRKAARSGGRGDLSLLDERQRASLVVLARVASFQIGAGGAAPAYMGANLSGNIARLRKRLEHVELVAAQRSIIADAIRLDEIVRGPDGEGAREVPAMALADDGATA